MHVIVLGGIARVGKTDVADIIEMEAEAEGMRVKRLSFATPLKDAVAEEHGYDDWRKFKEEKPEVYRDECQRIGAERRAENPDYWVDQWNEQLQTCMQEELLNGDGPLGWEEYLIIADDCRYPNELEAARKWEALTLFVYAGNRLSEVPEAEAAWRAHESEEMAQRVEAFEEEYQTIFDWAIFNDKGLEELEAKLQERMPYLLGHHGARFGRSCDCNECKAFMADVQPDEIIEHFRQALKEVWDDDTIPEDMKEEIRDRFDEVIEQIEDGDITPMDFFRRPWWLDKEVDDEDSEDRDS
jgi:hypothetical protein